jgi:hypothetical protein
MSIQRVILMGVLTLIQASVVGSLWSAYSPSPRRPPLRTLGCCGWWRSRAQTKWSVATWVQPPRFGTKEHCERAATVMTKKVTDFSRAGTARAPRRRALAREHNSLMGARSKDSSATATSLVPARVALLGWKSTQQGEAP